MVSPMNLVTGLWGMNVHVPGQDIEDGYAWFGGILGGLALFAILGAWATVSPEMFPTRILLDGFRGCCFMHADFWGWGGGL